MGFLKSKPSATVEEFCQNYYDTVIIDGLSPSLSYWKQTVFVNDTRYRSFEELILKDTLPATFALEMTAIHFEMFGLAWLHALKADDYGHRQTSFTHQYLTDHGTSSVWEAMLGYNQAIAKSSIEIAPGTKMRRGWVAFANSARSDLFDKWVRAGIDADCAARVANREMTDVSWKQGVAPWLIVETLGSRLGREIDGQSKIVFISAIQRFHDVAVNTLKSNKITL